MAANVAFSLYGQLKTKSGSFKGCTQDTFINSFYTNSGFTAFASAMKSAGVTGFSTSSVTSYTADCQGGVGVGCDASGGFAMHRYKSSICDPQNVTSVSNDLYYVNLAMKNAQCIQIYNSYKSSSYSSSSNDDDGASYYSSTPLALLYNSSACFYQNFFSPDGTCPDPFGRISYYKSNFYKEIQKSKAQRPVSLYKQQMEYEEKISAGRTKGEIGAFLLATAIVVVLCDKILYDCIKPMFWKKSDGLEKASTYRYDDGDDKSTTVQSQRSAGSDGNDTRFM